MLQLTLLVTSPLRFKLKVEMPLSDLKVSSGCLTQKTKASTFKSTKQYLLVSSGWGRWLIDHPTTENKSFWHSINHVCHFLKVPVYQIVKICCFLLYVVVNKTFSGFWSVVGQKFSQVCFTHFRQKLISDLWLIVKPAHPNTGRLCTHPYLHCLFWWRHLVALVITAAAREEVRCGLSSRNEVNVWVKKTQDRSETQSLTYLTNITLTLAELNVH